MESDTPRTDAENYIYDIGFDKWVSIEFARELERELAAANKMRDALRSELAGANIARAALAVRIGKLESQWLTLPHDPLRDVPSDLHERIDSIIPWMKKATTMLCDVCGLRTDECCALVGYCDAAIAAMRKEAARE